MKNPEEAQRNTRSNLGGNLRHIWKKKVVAGEAALNKTLVRLSSGVHD